MRVMYTDYDVKLIKKAAAQVGFNKGFLLACVLWALVEFIV